MGRLRSLNGRIVSATTMMVQRVAVQIPAILLALAIVAHTSEVSLDDTPLASMPAPGGHMELLQGLDRREHVAAGSRVSKRNHQMLVLKSQEIDVKAKIKSKRAALQKATKAELAEVSVGEAKKGAKGKGGRKKKQIEKRMGALEKEERKVKTKIKKIQSHPALQSGAKRAAAKVKAAVKAGDKKAVKKEQKKTAKAVTKAAKQLSKATTKGQKKKAEKKLAKAQKKQVKVAETVEKTKQGVKKKAKKAKKKAKKKAAKKKKGVKTV